jgi:hypothetical protein
VGEAPVFGCFSTFPGGKARIFIALLVVSAQNSHFDLVTPKIRGIASLRGTARKIDDLSSAMLVEMFW